MTYLNFPTPLWLLVVLALALVYVVTKTRVFGTLAFFLATCYSTIIVGVGPTTLVPVTFGALAVALLLHLRHAGAITFQKKGRSIIGLYLALMAWVLARGWIGLQSSSGDVQALLFLLFFVNIIPVLLADLLTWDDRAVRDFAKGFVTAVVLQMLIVWTRALGAGLTWTSWMTDFWLTRWASQESSPFATLTGIANYHWYSWNLGLAAMAALFILRGRQSRKKPLYLVGLVVFMIACIQQVALVGSRQSILSLIFAVLVISWTRIKKALLNVTAFAIVAFLALMALRMLADLEPLPAALMHGADTVSEAFDPAMSRGREWQKGIEAFGQSPIIGVGFGSDEGFSLGHNIVINTLANLGLVGLLAFGLLVVLYISGPLRSVLRQRDATLDINRGLIGMQLFLVGTSLASGSLVGSSALFWIGAIIVRRSRPPAPRKRPAPIRARTLPVPA
jgi:hypothetical protein